VERLYVATFLGGVRAASLHTSDGVPTLLPGPAINPTGHATTLAVHSSQQFVLVADANKHIDTYRIADDGGLPATPDSSIATPDTLITLALDAKGRFAYAGSQPGRAIYTFEIAPATGALQAVGEPMLVGEAPDGSAPAYIAADPSGRFVYVTLAGEPGIHGYRVNQDSGALTELEDSPFAESGLPEGDLLFGGAIAFKPSGDFLYTVGGALNAFAIDDATGALALVDGSPFTLDVQSDPNAPNIAVDPRGKYVYVSHFLGNNHVSGFVIDDASGKLEPVPGSPVTALAPYSIAIDPSGQFLFVGEDAPQTSVLSLSRLDGSLKKLPDSPFDFGGLEPKLVFSSAP
jgi:6-phosphogluconolactonase (cycloisomerase 2 family)